MNVRRHEDNSKDIRPYVVSLSGNAKFSAKRKIYVGFKITWELLCYNFKTYTSKLCQAKDCLSKRVGHSNLSAKDPLQTCKGSGNFTIQKIRNIIKWLGRNWEDGWRLDRLYSPRVINKEKIIYE